MAGTRRNEERPSGALLLLKILYWVLFAVSTVVVGLYIAFVVLVRPPEIPKPSQGVTAFAPSDDPATQIDESQVTPTEDPNQPTQRRRKEDCHTFLLMGMDAGNGNTDTMMVVTYDVKNQHVGVLSVPRDTLMDVPRTVKKINAAYAAGGVEEVQKEVSELLGFPVDHYIIINLRGFKALVNAVDGVDFNVPVDMHYDDPTQDLHIHLNKGMQHINGSQALQLVRFRSGYANADLGRIQTQQKFLTALAKKLLSWHSLTKMNDFVQIFNDNVKTDLSVGNMAYFAIAAMDLDTENGVFMGTLPGDGSVKYRGIPYYYQLFPQETVDLVNASGVNPYEEPITLDQMKIFQVS